MSKEEAFTVAEQLRAQAELYEKRADDSLKKGDIRGFYALRSEAQAIRLPMSRAYRAAGIRLTLLGEPDLPTA
jgi:hypothetical protein